MCGEVVQPTHPPTKTAQNPALCLKSCVYQYQLSQPIIILMRRLDNGPTLCSLHRSHTNSDDVLMSNALLLLIGLAHFLFRRQELEQFNDDDD